ncbi:NAD(P)-binding protein [Mycena vulgaris]|nr:NAD(P)-binding protein [Mycena vulgaris]
MGIPLSVGTLTPRSLWAVLQQSYFCGRPTWSERDIPDLSDQVVIVTGGNSGLGKETVRALLQHNAKVYMACRSRAKAEAAISELHKVTGREAIFLEVDLADLPSIKAASEVFLRQETKLHILYNNGGIMVPPVDLVTSDGYDLTFGTNVLGPFYMTKLLLPALLAAATSDSTTGRVVNLTSVIHYVADPDYATFKDTPARRKRHPADLYAQSKWANAVFSAELARRYGDDGIISTSVNPGNLRTNLSRDALGIAYFGTVGSSVSLPSLYLSLLYAVQKILMIWPVEWGVLGQLWAGTSPAGALLNGKHIVPWGRIGCARDDVDDPNSGKDLWTWLEEQVQEL